MRALILGIAGQDGSYLADLLVECGHEVHGIYRRSSTDNLARIKHLMDRVVLHRADITDDVSIANVLCEIGPNCIYNEADQDHVGWSCSTPRLSMDVTAGAVASLLESIGRYCPEAKVFQPISSTIFGNTPPPQNEHSPLDPRSPYAVAKAAALHLCRYYREVRDLFVSTAIFYNHDSPRRCTRGYLLHDICNGAIAVSRGEQERLLLGCLDMRVDIGYSLEFMQAAIRILSLSAADDFVIGTGNGATIRELAFYALDKLGVDGENRLGINPDFDRPGKQPEHIADISKAKRVFGFAPISGPKKLIDVLLAHKLEAYCK